MELVSACNLCFHNIIKEIHLGDYFYVITDGEKVHILEAFSHKDQEYLTLDYKYFKEYKNIEKFNNSEIFDSLTDEEQEKLMFWMNDYELYMLETFKLAPVIAYRFIREMMKNGFVEDLDHPDFTDWFVAYVGKLFEDVLELKKM
jgi:hypothetical protein